MHKHARLRMNVPFISLTALSTLQNAGSDSMTGDFKMEAKGLKLTDAGSYSPLSNTVGELDGCCL